MKKNTIILLMMLCSMSINAQLSVGASVGYDYNFYDFDTRWVSRVDYVGRCGLAVDLPVNYRINDGFELGTGLLYLQKGFLRDRLSSNGVEYCLRRDRYFGFPLVGRFLYGIGRVLLFCEVGGYASCWINSHIEGLETTLNGYYVNINQNMELSKYDNRFDFGLASGLGIQYSIDEHVTWVYAIKYYHSLSSQIKPSSSILSFPAYNRTIAIQVGVLYEFNN